MESLDRQVCRFGNSMRWGALGLAFRLELRREVRFITIIDRCLLRFDLDELASVRVLILVGRKRLER